VSVLVTGGAGFIGAEVVRELIERGEDEVHVAYHSGRLHRLGDLTERVGLHRLDLADTAALHELVAGLRPRSIHHLGAILSGPSEKDPQASIQANAYGTHALLEAARLNDVEQFLFASSIGVFVSEEQPDGPTTDATLQRPDLIYGVCKLFGELLGRYYQRSYGLDFRGIRYPGIVGPGVTTWSLAQCTCWVIEHPAKGEAFTSWLSEDTAFPLVYYKEAGRAMVELAQAPRDAIRSVNYNLGGVQPETTMGQLAAAVRARIPDARIDFQPDPAIQPLFEKRHPLDDSRARAEWGWAPTMDHEAMVDDFITEVRNHPERYG